jgi:protocatechuate 3,4-dioxygenase beta subunit
MGGEARLVEVTGRLVAALHGALEDLRVTEGELRRALAFLEEVGRAGEFTLLSDVLGVSVLVDRITHGDAGGTESNVEGPFYVPGAPVLDPPYRLAPEDEPGELLLVTGTVTDATTGAPVPGAVLDVWQANADGRYSNEEPGRLDPWHLRGKVPVSEDGSYEFQTVVPPPYEIPKDGPVGRLLRALGRHAFRPAHLHLKVTAPGYRPLTTMVFFAGDPWLGSDAIGAVKESLVVALERGGSGEEPSVARCRFDVRLVPDGRGTGRS